MAEPHSVATIAALTNAMNALLSVSHATKGRRTYSRVLRHLDAGLRGIEDGEQPQVPRDEKPDELVESQLRPLVQAALRAASAG
jgi:hypothetical protein